MIYSKEKSLSVYLWPSQMERLFHQDWIIFLILHKKLFIENNKFSVILISACCVEHYASRIFMDRLAHIVKYSTDASRFFNGIG